MACRSVWGTGRRECRKGDRAPSGQSSWSASISLSAGTSIRPHRCPTSALIRASRAVESSQVPSWVLYCVSSGVMKWLVCSAASVPCAYGVTPSFRISQPPTLPLPSQKHMLAVEVSRARRSSDTAAHDAGQDNRATL